MFFSRTASALVLAVLLSACGDRAATGPTATGPTSTGSQGTMACVARERGYRLEFPARWFTNDAGQSEPCRFFHPEPFSLAPGTEATGIAISVSVNPLPFHQVTPVPTGSMASEVLGRRTATLDGRPAVRVETQATGEALLAAGVRGVSWFVDLSPGTLVATTSEAAAAGRHADNVEVLDDMMQSLRVLERGSTCSAGRSAPAPTPQPALPARVSAMRMAMVDAARKCHYEALARLALEGNTVFTYSFGEEDQPAAFWKAAESGGRPVMRSLVEVLDAPFATRTVEGTTQYLWPSAYGFERWQDVPEADREALRQLYGDEDLRRFAQFGTYTGHRVGITENGDWIFFVAGD